MAWGSMIHRFAAILNCEVMVTPFVYLGMQVGECHKRREFWVGVVDSLRSRLSRWKGRSCQWQGEFA